jgi:hypothetical protein
MYKNEALRLKKLKAVFAGWKKGRYFVRNA